MTDHRKSRGVDAIEQWAAKDEWEPIESAVLHRAIDRASQHPPARITVHELIRELAGEDASSTVIDAVEVAVERLKGVGLFHAIPDFAEPTVAALRLTQLLEA